MAFSEINSHRKKFSLNIMSVEKTKRKNAREIKLIRIVIAFLLLFVNAIPIPTDKQMVDSRFCALQLFPVFFSLFHFLFTAKTKSYLSLYEKCIYKSNEYFRSMLVLFPDHNESNIFFRLIKWSVIDLTVFGNLVALQIWQSRS